jgi:hypothetical protein
MQHLRLLQLPGKGTTNEVTVGGDAEANADPQANTNKTEC